jgi:M6 family metalloprotease-like protein
LIGANALGPVPCVAQPAFRQASYSDTLRVLLLFVKFKDDQTVGDPNVDFRGWPLFSDPERLPAHALSLVSASSSPPFPDSSLSDYFYRQSNGKLIVWGDVYPKVLVTQQNEAAYHKPDGGYGTLTTELLTRIDAAGVDFTRYDGNEDGIVDQLFIILRRDSERDARRERYTGISCLDARCGGTVTANKSRQPDLVFDGVKVDWSRSGSYLYNRVPGSIIPQLWLVRLMAHEFGHDLWAGFYNHIPALTDNSYPVHKGREKNAIGYVLMAGAGGARDTGGSFTLSAFERLLLDWIECPAMTNSQSVVLGDLYTTGSCRLLNFEVNGRGRTLILSNLQRIGFFDRYRTGGINSQFELGLLRTEGLLVSVTDGIRTDVLPADGDLELTNSNSDYHGDLYGPGSKRQLTPWTRPAFTGYTDGVDERHEWAAVDDVRYLNESDRTLGFEFISDFRNSPNIRENSIIESGDSRVEINESLSIVDRASLIINSDVLVNGEVNISHGSSIEIGPLGSLTIQPGSPLRMGDQASLVVRGTLTLSGSVMVWGSAVIDSKGGTLRWRTTIE